MSKFEKIFVEITNFCGLSCKFCTPKKSNDKMPLLLFEKICNDIYPHTKLCALHILGDPLSLDNIEEYIKIAKNKNLNLEITSSGFYLDTHTQNILLKYNNIKQINISLTSAIYQNKDINLDSYFQNIFSLCAKHKELKSETFINLRLWNLDSNFKAPDINQTIYKILEEQFKIRIHNHKTKLSYKIHLIQKSFFSWEFKDKKQLHGKCYGTISQLGILTSGVVVPCCFCTKGEINLGDIGKNSLLDIINNQKTQKIKQGFLNNLRVESMCQKCSYPNYISNVKNA